MKFFALVLCFSVAFALPQRGKQVPVKNLSGRVINGEPAVQGQFPWQVGLVIMSASYPFYFTLCGGSIISDQWILTAGHCLDDAGIILVSAGSILINDAPTNIVSSAIQHELYDPYTLENDLALTKVDDPWIFDENIQAVVINYNDVVGVGVPVTVSGWGSTSDSGDSSTTLNYITLTTIDTVDCGKEYNTVFYDGVLCANSGDSPKVLSTCGGDSGGPLVNSNNELVGVVSFGHNDGCESGHSSGFTRTSYFESWIKNNTQTESVKL